MLCMTAWTEPAFTQTENVMAIVPSFTFICLLLVTGKFLRVRIRLFQKLYLPSAIIGGILGLVIVQVSGRALPSMWTAGWERLPGFLINIVFAALFLGVAIPSISTIWKKSGPQLAYGQIVAWGQWVIGIGFVLFLLKPVFGMPELFGSSLPVGFEGGHGTAGGLKDTFTALGWAEGGDFSLASATAGIISAIITGVALINWAARKGYVSTFKQEKTAWEMRGIYPEEKQPYAGRLTVISDSVDTLALHIAIIGMAVLIGYGIKTGLAAAEQVLFHPEKLKLFAGFPLFPLCMIGGLIIQLFLTKTGNAHIIDRSVSTRVGSTALDFLVVSAISTIKLSVIAQGLIPLLILVAGGIVWNVFCVVFLARRVLPSFWFERAIAEMGKSMGVTATGLLLLRIVDPEQKTDAATAFGYKQLLHEPIMGGGIWTSTAVFLIAAKGGMPVLVISVSAIVIWLAVIRLVFLKKG